MTRKSRCVYGAPHGHLEITATTNRGSGTCHSFRPHFPTFHHLHKLPFIGHCKELIQFYPSGSERTRYTLIGLPSRRGPCRFRLERYLFSETTPCGGFLLLL